MTATLADAVYGLAVGDALGVPYEFQPRDTFVCTGMRGGGTYGKPAGTWSDDTSMTLATCDSIKCSNGVISTDDMRWRFCKWKWEDAYTVDGMFDIGGTTATALEEGRGCTHDRSCGNGSLMRIAPLAFTKANGVDVGRVSAITHAHPVCIKACRIYVEIARKLIGGAHPTDVPEIARMKDVPRESVESGGYVVDTLGAALWCMAQGHSYAECVLAAVNLGRDTDTTAAVTGALAGIVYGKEDIPVAWLDALRGKEIIDNVLF